MRFDSPSAGRWRSGWPWHSLYRSCGTDEVGGNGAALLVWLEMRTTGPERVLLIDDDELSRAVLELHLSAAGYAVTEAESGEAAVALLQASPADFDVVLCDLQMPGLHGPALAQQLRLALSAPLPLLAMSGSQPLAERYAGYDAFLLKPFSPEQLAAVLGGARVEAPEGAARLNEPDVLDEETFAQLQSMMKPAQIGEIFGLALRELGTHLEQMQAAFAAGEAATLQAAAHAMKGGFSVLGAPELRSLGAVLEAGTGTAADQTATLREIPLAAERLRRMLTSRGLRVESDPSSGQETR